MEGPPLRLDGAPRSECSRRGRSRKGGRGATHPRRRAPPAACVACDAAQAGGGHRDGGGGALRRRAAAPSPTRAPTTELLSTRSRKMTYKEWKARNRRPGRAPALARPRADRRALAHARCAAAAVHLGGSGGGVVLGQWPGVARVDLDGPRDRTGSDCRSQTSRRPLRRDARRGINTTRLASVIFHE